MISAVLFISFFIFLILGVPIAICLGLSSVCAILYSGTSLTIVATNMYAGISKFLLLAIPFFVLSGNIMAKAGISKRLIDFVDTCVGHKKGGIAIVCVIVRSNLRFRTGNCSCSRRSPDSGNGRAGRIFRTVLYGVDGDIELDRDRHTSEYRIRCIRIHHRCFHR